MAGLIDYLLNDPSQADGGLIARLLGRPQANTGAMQPMPGAPGAPAAPFTLGDSPLATALRGALAGLGGGAGARGFLPGLAAGMGGAQQFQGQRENMLTRRTLASQQATKFQQDQQDRAAEEQAAADLKQKQDAFRATLPPDRQKIFDIVGADAYGKLYAEHELYPKSAEPNSAIAKAQADLKAGLITQPQFDAIARKETYIAPQQGPQEPETIRLMRLAGIDPASSEGKHILQAKLAGSNGITIGPDGTVQIGGPAGKPATEDMSKNAQLYQEILPEAPILMQNYSSLEKLTNQLGAATPDVISSYLTTPEYQQAADAIAHIIANNLYSLSGAQITPAEADRRAKLLLPRPGESAQSIANKKERIKALYDGMRTRAGKAAADLPMPDFGSPPNGTATPRGGTPMSGAGGGVVVPSLNPADGWQ